MSLFELGLLALHGVSLTGIAALLLSTWHRHRQDQSAPPDHFDVELPRSSPRILGGWGQVQITPYEGSGFCLGEALDGLRIYEVWALTGAGWVQLLPGPSGRWTSPLLQGQEVHGLRLWVDLDGPAPPNTRPARRAAPMLLAASLLLATGKDPPRPGRLPEVLPRLLPQGEHLNPAGWAVRWAQRPSMAPLLHAWTEACTSASKVGWVVGIPVGEALFEAWARTATPGRDPATFPAAFAQWWVGELGKATRQGALERSLLEVREPAAQRLFRTANRILQALDPSLTLQTEPPLAVGEGQTGRWLVDLPLAAALGNPPVNGLVQPVVVLRPVLLQGGVVLVEGEVA